MSKPTGHELISMLESVPMHRTLSILADIADEKGYHATRGNLDDAAHNKKHKWLDISKALGSLADEVEGLNE